MDTDRTISRDQRVLEYLLATYQRADELIESQDYDDENNVHIRALNILIDRYRDEFAKSITSLLTKACDFHYMNAVQVLLDRGAILDESNARRTEIHRIFITNNIGIPIWRLIEGVEFDDNSEKHLTILRCLLSKMSPQRRNMRDILGRETILHMAARKGFLNAVKILLEPQYGIDYTLMDRNNRTAAYIASNDTIKQIIMVHINMRAPRVMAAIPQNEVNGGNSIGKKKKKKGSGMELAHV